MVSAYYEYHDAKLGYHTGYVLPEVLRILMLNKPASVFDFGCGNGSVAGAIASLGVDVAGSDASEQAVAVARQAFPFIRFEVGLAGDDLASRFGRFDAVVSLEVVEHVFLPRLFAKTVFDLVADGGVAIISTPFHGYWKNLALALSGKMDSHFTALWDYGHIKFWSEKTLAALLTEAGFSRVEFRRVGRIPPLAKSMIAVAYR